MAYILFFSGFILRLMHIIEKLIQSKTGHTLDCEDEIVITNDLVAIIDGATSKTNRRYEGLPPGKMAAQLLAGALTRLPIDVGAHAAVMYLTGQIAAQYQAHGLVEHLRQHPVERICGSLILYHRHHRQIWRVGDSFHLINGQAFRPRDRAEVVNANARAMYLELMLLEGQTIDQLRQQDVGRAFIMPLLTRMAAFHNNAAAGEYASAVLDGFPVPPSLIQVVPVPADCQEVVLASDGYPMLFPSLAATEAHLQAVLHDDPLCFRRFKATKGMQPGHLSFDDRAYVRFVP